MTKVFVVNDNDLQIPKSTLKRNDNSENDQDIPTLPTDSKQQSTLENRNPVNMIKTVTEKSKIRPEPEQTVGNTVVLNVDENNAETSRNATADEILNLERYRNEDNAHLRNQTLKAILTNAPVEVSWTKTIFCTCIIIILSFSTTVPYSLIPTHDLVQQPEFWYEIIFHGTIINTFNSVYFCVLAGYFGNMSHIRKLKYVSIMCVKVLVIHNSFLIFNYYIWTHVLGYQFPIPFQGHGITYLCSLVQFTILYFGFPSNVRNNPDFRNRMKFLFVAMHIFVALDVPYNVISMLLQKFQNQYQPIIAMLLPITRELIIWSFSTVIAKTSREDENSASMMLKFVVSVQHTTFLCYAMASFATDITSWVLMGIDFSMNIYLSLRLVWLKKKRPESIQDQIDILQDLAIYELTEFYTPLSFLLVVILAYHGPNAELFGNIKNAYWTFTAIEDIEKTIANMLLFFLIDFSSAVASTIILQLFCRINICKVFAATQKEFALTFCIILGYFVLLVRIKINDLIIN